MPPLLADSFDAAQAAAGVECRRGKAGEWGRGR